MGGWEGGRRDLPPAPAFLLSHVCLNSVERWNGTEWNECCSTHVLQPTDDLILNCTSHLVTMIAIASRKGNVQTPLQ